MNTKTFKVIKEFSEDNKWLDANSDLKKKWAIINEKYNSSVKENDKKSIIKYKEQLDQIGGDFYKLNQGLAYNLAKTFFINNDSRSQDYIQAAALGLWEAFLKWDPENGASFSTFSRAYIKGRTQRAVRSDEFSHLTQNDFAKRRDVLLAKDLLSKSLGRDPSISEIAKHVKITNELADRIIFGSNISLFTKISEDGGTLEDLIAEKAEKNDLISSIFESEEIVSILDELSELEFWVMSQRLEILGGDYSRSLLEIGEDIGVGREIARRAETRARVLIAYHYLISKLGRFPNDEELSILSGVDKDKLNISNKVSFQDLYSRFLRKRLKNEFNKNEWYRFGTDFIISIYPSLIEILESKGKSIDKIDKEELTNYLLFFYDTFLLWSGNEEVTFPAYLRKNIDQKFTKSKRFQNKYQNPEYTDIIALWDIVFESRLKKRKISL